MKHNYLKLFMLCLFSLAGMSTYAYDCEIDGIYYNLNTENYTATVTYKVNAHNESSISTADLYSGVVNIPESITYNGATYTVDSISDDAFYEGRITEISIPNSVVTIGNRAFYWCSSLEKLIIGNNVTIIGNEAFALCFELRELTIGNSVTSIGNYAFKSCHSLTELTIPNSVTTIGSHAFDECHNLYNVYIPCSVISIGAGAFAYCDFGEIVVDGDNTYYDSREDCNAIISTESNVLVAGCRSTKIPNSVTAIGNFAFAGCPFWRDREIVIPNSVTFIGDYAFDSWLQWESLDIPNSVTYIGNHAFAGWDDLQGVTIPNSVTFIGEGVFEGCRNLGRIVVDSSNPCYDSRENCNAIIHTDENLLVSGCMNTHIPYGVATIGNYAFARCPNLTKLTIPNSVTSIGNSAFIECYGLTNLPIPNSVVSFGENAFSECQNLIELVIPNNVTSIGEGTFGGCSSLTELIIPNSVTFIGDYAFHWCRSLTELTIGNNVTNIGRSAFGGCTSLTSVTSLNMTPPTITDDVWESEVTQNAILHVPTGCKTVYMQAYGWHNFLNIQDDVSAGIESVITNKHSKNEIYTIDGMRLNTTNVSDLPAGIYIVNGKKVVVK